MIYRESIILLNASKEHHNKADNPRNQVPLVHFPDVYWRLQFERDVNALINYVLENTTSRYLVIDEWNDGNDDDCSQAGIGDELEAASHAFHCDDDNDGSNDTAQLRLGSRCLIYSGTREAAGDRKRLEKRRNQVSQPKRNKLLRVVDLQSHEWLPKIGMFNIKVGLLKIVIVINFSW